jgi:hypothetical protein
VTPFIDASADAQDVVRKPGGLGFQVSHGVELTIGLPYA